MDTSCHDIVQQTSHRLWGWASLKIAIHAHFFQQTILTHIVGQTNLVLSMCSGFISRFGMQDYKTLWAAVAMCSTLVNIQTHAHTDSIWSAYLISSALWAKMPTFQYTSNASCEIKTFCSIVLYCCLYYTKVQELLFTAFLPRSLPNILLSSRLSVMKVFVINNINLN